MKNGTPLIETDDVGLVARGYRFGNLIAENVGHVLTREELEYWEAHLKEIREGLARFANRSAGRSLTEKEMVASWEAYFRYGYGLKVDFSGVKIPKKRSGFGYLIAVPQGITMNRVYDVSSNPGHIPSWRYVDDLDKAITVNDRDPNRDGSYFVWVRGGVEADEGHRNKSADMLKTEGVLTVTTLEQLLFRHKFWLDTGTNVDQKTWTLHGGSRYSVGYVPNSNWSGGKSRVYWNYTHSRSESLRGREVVS
ncbi:MAG: hypothetical protein WC027_02555 [Candidatus Paceibacterota bacterium]